MRRQREHLLHRLSLAYAKNQGVIAIEKLNIKGMIQNPNLARQIANASWGKFAKFLGYKTIWYGSHLIEVPAAYSSPTCFVCGAVDSESRYNETFCCTSCGHIDHADVNAAKIIKSRVIRSGQPVEGSSMDTLRSRKPKIKIRRFRRKQTLEKPIDSAINAG